MCGLAGAAGAPEHATATETRARAISNAIAHRGPDGESSWAGDGALLSHRRLAILDVSECGRQPMVSGDGRWVITHNGEIYNHLELRATLPGPWTSTSDGETIARLLEVEGIASVPRLDGMFAIAAWDRQERALHLVRDRLGIKPLHYAATGDGIAYASEPAAIAAAQPAKGLARHLLGPCLAAGYPPPGRTLFEGVLALEPAEALTWKNGQITRRKYWALPETTIEGRSDESWQEAFEAALLRSVDGHLLSDVPIGIFLSGGFDSAAVAIAATDSGRVASALTARFPDARYDESADASALAARLGLAWNALDITPAAVDELVPRLARHNDLPCCDSSSLGTWLLCEGAARSMKVALTGDGADEVLAGYPTHRATELLVSPVGPFLRAASRAVGSRLPRPRPSSRPVSVGEKVTRLLRYAHHAPLDAHLRWRTLLHPDSLAEAVPGATTGDAWDIWQPATERYPRQPLLNRMLALDVEGYLPQDELTRADRMGMAHGLEIRVPLLDHHLVEIAFQMPYTQKSHAGRGKRPLARWIERRGFADVTARPKRGFNHPVAAWFRGPLGERLDERLRTSPLAPLFDRAAVGRWLDAHRRSREDRGHELWAVLFLLEWGQVHGVSA